MLGKAEISMRVVILSRSAKDADGYSWGLGQDSKIVEQVLREVCAGGTARIESIDHFDATAFYGSARRPMPVDLTIHLEVPCRAAMMWSKYNIVIVNQEWWFSDAWAWATAPVEKGGADLFLFKSNHARSKFPSLENKRCRVISWRCGSEIGLTQAHLSKSAVRREFLYLIGASANKTLAAHSIVGAWKKSWPALTVVGVEAVLDELRAAVPSAAENGVTFRLPFGSDSERIEAQRTYGYHVVGSAAEGFGYTFAEAAAIGALPLWTGIPVYDELYGEILGGIGKIAYTGAAVEPTKVADTIYKTWSEDAIVAGVDSLLTLADEHAHRLSGTLRHISTTRVKEFRHAWKAVVSSVLGKLKTAPPVGLPPRAPAISDLPHVAIISVTRNRPKWFTNMARNILLTDYPTTNFTWIIADDGDSGRIDTAVAKFQEKNPMIRVKYLSYPKQLYLGAKRNRACEAAPADASVFVMMDDDDHYPKNSLIARVAWLLGSKRECVYCSTIPIYDVGRYVSAINVPPLDLSPAERVSEATLCFTRKFWTDRKFPGPVSIAEGEGFIAGREEQTAEIPPEGVIVSFIHGGNSSSRRVPTGEPNGCHFGFDDEYFSYISSLALE
jgi:hypothetical protein